MNHNQWPQIGEFSRFQWWNFKPYIKANILYRYHLQEAPPKIRFSSKKLLDCQYHWNTTELSNFHGSVCFTELCTIFTRTAEPVQKRQTGKLLTSLLSCFTLCEQKVMKITITVLLNFNIPVWLELKMVRNCGCCFWLTRRWLLGAGVSTGPWRASHGRQMSTCSYQLSVIQPCRGIPRGTSHGDIPKVFHLGEKIGEDTPWDKHEKTSSKGYTQDDNLQETPYEEILGWHSWCIHAWMTHL